MSRLFNAMESIYAFFFFLPLVITGLKNFRADPFENYPPNFRYDITIPLLNSIDEMLELADPNTIRNSYNEFILQQEPSVIRPQTVRSKNITFSKFISDKDIISFLNVNSIFCEFHNRLQVSFENIGDGQKNKSIEGRIKFLLSENNTSECQLPFNIKFNALGSIDLSIEYRNQGVEKYTYNLSDIFDKYQNFSQPSNRDEISCMTAYEDQLRSIYEDILLAIKKQLTDRLELITKSTFRLFIDKCHYLNKEFDEHTQEYYVHLKTRIIYDEMRDYYESVIRGLNNIKHISIDYENKEEAIYELLANNVSINCYVMFVNTNKSKQFDIEVDGFLMSGTINHNRSMRISNIIWNQFTSKQNSKYKYDESLEEKKQLEKYITYSMAEAFFITRIPYNYTTAKNAKTPLEILNSFHENIFESLAYNLDEIKPGDDFSSGNVRFSIVEADGDGRNLETLSCLLPGYSLIGKIIYKKLSTKIEYRHEVNEKRINKLSISGDMQIHDLAIPIFLNRSSDTSAQLEMDIDGAFKLASIMIAIDPGDYYLFREERILIGKRILTEFVKTTDQKIVTVINSMVNPILRGCENSFGFEASLLERTNNREQFFASIYNPGTFSTNPVHTVIYGWWNYQFISVQHVNKKTIFSGLQIKNITASIKQFGFHSEDTVLSNYEISTMIITIDHTNQDVQINIPRFQDYKTDFIEDNITVYDYLELIVASFIEQSIYGTQPNYYKKVWKLSAQALENKIRMHVYRPGEYDGTSIFTEIFVEKLIMGLNFQYNQFNQRFESAIMRGYSSNETKFRIDSLNLTIITSIFDIDLTFGDTFIREEICSHAHHSLKWTEVKNIPLTLTYTADIVTDSSESFEDIPFTIHIDGIDFSYNHSDATLQFREQTIDDEDTRIQFRLPIENKRIMRLIEKTEQNDLRKKFIQITNSFWNKRFRVKSPSKTFCGLPQETIGKKVRSEMLSYSINTNIEFTSQRFFMFHIRTFGLLNFKRVRFEVTEEFVHFELTITDLDSNIYWVYYTGGLISRTPEVVSQPYEAGEILLAGKIDQNTGILEFTNNSILVMGSESWMTSLETIFLKSIQQVIEEKFNTMRSKMYYFT